MAYRRHGDPVASGAVGAACPAVNLGLRRPRLTRDTQAGGAAPSLIPWERERGAFVENAPQGSAVPSPVWATASCCPDHFPFVLAFGPRPSTPGLTVGANSSGLWRISVHHDLSGITSGRSPNAPGDVRGVRVSMCRPGTGRWPPQRERGATFRACRSAWPHPGGGRRIVRSGTRGARSALRRPTGLVTSPNGQHRGPVGRLAPRQAQDEPRGTSFRNVRRTSARGTSGQDLFEVSCKGG
jgi:hypothetical protein